jgi:hypothetical protein
MEQLEQYQLSGQSNLSSQIIEHKYNIQQHKALEIKFLAANKHKWMETAFVL